MRLFDRTTELEILSEAFAACTGGSGQLVIVTGGPGSGKTELVYEFLTRAGETGALVLTATASRMERARPMSVFSQLLHSGDVSCDARDLIPPPDAQGGTKSRTEHGPSGVDHISHQVTTSLLELSQGRPVVIAIDDAHLMDNDSLHTTLDLLRRMRTRKILVICVSWGLDRLTGSHVHADLIRRPHRRIRLTPLSETGVAAMLIAQAGRRLPRQVSDAYHRATAGNPMLVHALLDDSARFGALAAEPVASTAYRQAVLACLHRGERRHARIARAVAALDEYATPRTTSLLAGAGPGPVQEVVDILNSTGLLDGYRFRHPAGAAAVLQDLAPAERSRLHGEVARQLYLDGVPAPEVARHLVTADRIPDDWGSAVLRAAAEQALADDDVKQCTTYLRLLLQDAEDGAERHALLAALGRAEWRVNPAAAGTHLAPLRQPALDGTLDARDTATVARHMLWQGDIESAATAVSRLGPSLPRSQGHSIAEVEFIRQWFYGVPRVGRRGEPSALASLEPGAVDGTHGLGPKVAQLISGSATDESVANVAEALQGHRLDHLKPELVAMSLLAIAHTDRTQTAARVCDAVLKCTVERKATTWQALIGSVRAEIALLQGDVATAELKATQALDMLHAQGWGVLIGLPLSTAVFARTSMGKHDAAAHLLKREVPEAMFGTIFGIQYLRARGHHYLATDRAFAALNDFESCGRLMRDGNPHLQKGIPWCADLAQANLRIGKVRTAREWVEKQIRLPGGHSSRSRAMALRVLAGASQPHQRTSLLRESIDLLKACGDRLELALAYADLSAAHYELGEYDRARLVARQAAQEAEWCQIASPVDNRLVASAPAEKPEGEEIAAPVLSDAECRVAGLAALGYTNREISSRIHVTISTVEQHLTRVYRKLNVASRAELPSKVLEHQIPTMSEHPFRARSSAVEGRLA
ncbi:AAA family ATPase [Streptomyces sp. NA02950]|uniref:AAA family ATPase n=1 Tax=Streptomyces sp. NA02950 TaxID=2742137 RepID=UPI00159168AE|nr:LuxR family transcriptional regulator [Streptomyces sp. NA02950]QKV96585.1 AAA family ATPase [Streptomyces sp. NA02950]